MRIFIALSCAAPVKLQTVKEPEDRILPDTYVMFDFKAILMMSKDVTIECSDCYDGLR
jgi:hypothetical protein